MLLVGGSVTWDSNVFKLSKAEDPLIRLGTPDKSDRFTTAYAGLRIDQPYAQQRFELGITRTAYRYDNFSFLNFDASEYRAAWRWHLTPRVSGTLSADRNQAPVSFADFRGISQRNVRTTENRLFSVDALLFGGWHVLARATQDERRNSVEFLEERSFREAGAEAGLRYIWRSGNTLTFNLRSADGEYVDRPVDPVNLIDAGFRREERELLGRWRLGGKSSFDGRLARIYYWSNNFPQRDFAGSEAQLGFLWSLTAKTRINLSANLDLQPVGADYASYKEDKALSFSPSWQIAARTTARISLSRVVSDYRNPLVGFTGPRRRDNTRSAQLSLAWNALRNLSVSASVQRELRTSTDPANDFESTIAKLDASLLF